MALYTQMEVSIEVDSVKLTSTPIVVHTVLKATPTANGFECYAPMNLGVPFGRFTNLPSFIKPTITVKNCYQNIEMYDLEIFIATNNPDRYPMLSETEKNELRNNIEKYNQVLDVLNNIAKKYHSKHYHINIKERMKKHQYARTTISWSTHKLADIIKLVEISRDIIQDYLDRGRILYGNIKFAKGCETYKLITIIGEFYINDCKIHDALLEVRYNKKKQCWDICFVKRNNSMMKDSVPSD